MQDEYCIFPYGYLALGCSSLTDRSNGEYFILLLVLILFSWDSKIGAKTKIYAGDGNCKNIQQSDLLRLFLYLKNAAR